MMSILVVPGNIVSILVVPGNIGKAGVVEHRRQRKHEVQLAKGSGIPV